MPPKAKTTKTRTRKKKEPEPTIEVELDRADDKSPEEVAPAAAPAPEPGTEANVAPVPPETPTTEAPLQSVINSLAAQIHTLVNEVKRISVENLQLKNAVQGVATANNNLATDYEKFKAESAANNAAKITVSPEAPNDVKEVFNSVEVNNRQIRSEISEFKKKVEGKIQQLEAKTKDASLVKVTPPPIPTAFRARR